MRSLPEAVRLPSCRQAEHAESVAVSRWACGGACVASVQKERRQCI